MSALRLRCIHCTPHSPHRTWSLAKQVTDHRSSLRSLKGIRGHPEETKAQPPRASQSSPSPSPAIQKASNGAADRILRSRERWACIKDCGACCQLDKGPEAPPIESILKDPVELELYKSMVGEGGWCVHFDRATRMCSIYDERPRFCRAEREVFLDLFGLKSHEVDKAACSMCRDSIHDVYGGRSRELTRFDDAVRDLARRHSSRRRKF